MRKFLLGCTASALATATFADTSSLQTDGDGLLENMWVKAGVNATSGTFGSGGSTSPGLLFDPTGTGTFDVNYDYLTPGTPFDGQALKIDGTNYSNNNYYGAFIPASGALVDGANTLTWSGAVDGWSVENVFTLGDTLPYIDVSTKITAGADAATVSYGKYIDPDSQGMVGDSFATDNVLGYAGVPTNNLAFSEATVSRYALGVYSTDGNTTAGIEAWTEEADGYDGIPDVEKSRPAYLDEDGNELTYGNGDDTIGISWTWTGVTTGDILEAQYAYIFGPSAFDAMDDAVEGGAGGGTPGTLPEGWSLSDVGSATDGAASGATGAPAVTTETVVNPDLPVLTASITTHSSTVENGVQTIAREKTTTTTTPMMTNTYTGDTLTSSEAAPSVVTTEVTNPESFVARMDHGERLRTAINPQDLGIIEGFAYTQIRRGIGDGDTARSHAARWGWKMELPEGLTGVFGFNRVFTVADAGTMLTRHFGFGVEKDFATFSLSATGNIAHQSVSYSRVIGDFENQGTFTGRDNWLEVMATTELDNLSPYVKVVAGRQTQGAFSETGSVQSALDFEAFGNNYRYAEVGLSAALGDLATVNASFDTTRTRKFGVAGAWDLTDEMAIEAKFDRTMERDMPSLNEYYVGLSMNF